VADRAGPPVSGATQVAAVIGSPVRHSLSPILLNAAFRAAGLDWVFTAFEVPEGAGGAAVAAMRTLGLGGLSVTMPHKVAAYDAVDERTLVAEDLRAVNCVYRRGGLLVGDNTDGPGFVDALAVDEGVELHGRRCVLLGAGGAGRAVARALGAGGAAEVVVVNRSPEPARRAAELAGDVGRIGDHGDVAGADLVVNATSLGMAGGEEQGSLPVDADLLHAGQVVFDLVYHPLETPLLAAARARGAEAVNGVGMLVHQAAHAFVRWTDEAPPLREMATAIRHELARRAPPDRSSSRS
jgi:shikimate dehydrogenase